MLRRAVDEDPLRREALGTRGEEFELADDFNGPVLPLPPLHERTQWLRFEREPVANRQLAEVPVEFLERLLDWRNGEEVERRWLSANQRLQE